MTSVRRAPEPIPYPPQGEIVGALATADRRWQVQVVQHGDGQSYRLIHGDNEIDALDLDTVQQLLAKADVSVAELVDVTAQLPARGRIGAA